jgi:hypothetical protein
VPHEMERHGLRLNSKSVGISRRIEGETRDVNRIGMVLALDPVGTPAMRVASAARDITHDTSAWSR